MKKAKLALIAVCSVIGIGSTVAASNVNVYYTSATGSDIIPGEKDQDWECVPKPEVTCAYLEQPDGSRTKLTGQFREME